jgi:hypothetical protein
MKLRWDLSNPDNDGGAVTLIALRAISRWPGLDYSYGFLKGDWLVGAKGRSQQPYHRYWTGLPLTGGIGRGDTGFSHASFSHEAGHGLAGMCHDITSGLSGQTGWDYHNQDLYRDTGGEPFIQGKSSNSPAMSAGMDDQHAWNSPSGYSEFEFKQDVWIHCEGGTRTVVSTSTSTPTTTPPPPTSTGVIPIPSVGPPPSGVVNPFLISVNQARTEWRISGMAALVNTVKQPNPRPVGMGDDSVRMYDSNEELLYETGLELLAVDPDTDYSSLVLLPDFGNAATVQVFADGVLKVGLNRSSNPPSVSISSPISGDALIPGSVIIWQSSDADGDTLLQSIDYACPATNRLTPLEFDVAGGSVSLTQEALDQVPSCVNGSVRVRSSDGFDTTVAVVSGIAVLPDRTPSVLIQSPEDGSVIAAGSNFVLVADIGDPEDLYFNKSSVTWSSSLDGGLGSGPIRNASLDTMGVHIITVTVVDSVGNSTVATVTVTVN